MGWEEEQFLVAGALLECTYGTTKCRLKESNNCARVQIRDSIFLSINAAKIGENLDGFGMCSSKECTGGTIPCIQRIFLADKWMNPIAPNPTLMIQGQEAIRRYATLFCMSGKAYIHAVITGQKELTESEKKFYKYMSEYFGFDDDVIAIMLKVIYAIDEEYPKESEKKKAWRFARLMGGFSYGFGDEDRFIEIRNEINDENELVNKKNIIKDVSLWNLASGIYDDFNKNVNEKDYFVDKLKLSEVEYYKLRFHVMVQREITSRPASCYPYYMIDGIEYTVVKEDGSLATHTHNHPYYDVWKKYFEDYKLKEEPELANKSEDEVKAVFAEEWRKLYKKYVAMPIDEYDDLLNENTIFFPYPDIESDAKEKGYHIEPKYTDFSHQQILTAAITSNISTDVMVGTAGFLAGPVTMQAPMFPLSPYIGIGLGVTTNTYRPSLAGWLGDIRLADNKMSEDDYKADLDGLNVSKLIIKEDINTIEAINKYYGALESGATTREKEFLCNMGNGDASKGYENIKTLDNGFVLFQHAKNKVLSSIKGEELLEVTGDDTLKDFLEKIEVGKE